MKLYPAVIQDHMTGQILMLAYMNQEALDQTLGGDSVVFWSRSRQQLWKKGQTSGHYLRWTDWSWDCDHDSLVFQVAAEGPACHLQTKSCFNDIKIKSFGVLEKLEERIQTSIMAKGETTTKKEFNKGLSHWIRKLQEEACETSLAAVFETPNRLVSETSDLLYRLGLLLHGQQISIKNLDDELEERALMKPQKIK
jgi:phosphoribosyl-ATP pyrophosphohydrolase/phosphoribosyl-AMP cyclohydrolase